MPPGPGSRRCRRPSSVSGRASPNCSVARWAANGCGEPLGWTEIYIAEPYIAARRRFTVGPEPYYEQVRREFGLVVREVEQRLSAVAIPAESAALLDAQAGDPAVLVRRRYFALGDSPFEVSLSIHPADRYAYTARLTRGVSRPEPLPA
jgi:hypothetical protein